MSRALESITLNEILPSSVGDDETISALATALSTELQRVTANINKILIYPRIEELSEEVIDLLAEQFQVSFYNSLGLDLTTKRTLVQNAIVWNKRKGTKAVMQEMLSTLYNSNATVQEWFEYGGEPYHFRVYLDNIQLGEEDRDSILYIINELKNVRSHLDNIVVKLTLEGTLYVGGVIKQRRKQILKAKVGD